MYIKAEKTNLQKKKIKKNKESLFYVGSSK